MRVRVRFASSTKKILWCATLASFQAPNKIQPFGRPDGGGTDGAAHNTSSVFTDKNGNRCFLYVNRNDVNRKLNLTNVDRKWNDNWAFLDERLFLPLRGSFL